MPLSDEFSKSRQKYLQIAINNNKKTNQKFYPRFQRQYNEMFPYTESSVESNFINPTRGRMNILNPQKQIIQDNITKPDPVLIEQSLKDKLNELTWDDASSQFIIDTLDEAEKYYYDKNFESITKELSKKIQNPTSKEDFSRTLSIILNSTTHKNDLFGIYKYLNPTMPTRAELAAAQISAGNPQPPIIIPAGAQGPAGPAGPAGPSGPAGPTPAPLPGPGGPTPSKGPAPTTKTPPSPGFLLRIKTELHYLVEEDKKQYNKNNNKRSNAKVPQNEIDGFIAVRRHEIMDKDLQDDLARLMTIKGTTLAQNEINDAIVEHQKRFIGFGIKQKRFIKDKEEFHEKYALDKKKLNKNVLALKYLKNANNVATFKPIEISDHFKKLIEQNIMKGHKIEDTDFKSLSVTEKRILKRLYSFLKLDFEFEHNDDFQKEFEVILAGNNNADLKRKLKEYVKLALHEAIISKEAAKTMMDKLSK